MKFSSFFSLSNGDTFILAKIIRINNSFIIERIKILGIFFHDIIKLIGKALAGWNGNLVQFFISNDTKR
ncbi:hypothetical protein BpHYR1_016917 [Brachionus plicatilis]|uniref:Uncharacterized protein n=1 Tax=Brachionus plicatilis TaxID=10195 RepID=A0A3M7SEX9_BRAPC|nr:hypothetical protein BpHYR1_016917 [Brachionus plicatilis]